MRGGGGVESVFTGVEEGGTNIVNAEKIGED